MNKIAGQHNVDTILANGDNFYSSGITEDTAMVRFRDTFENVYTGEHLQGATFYPTLGNHDHRGDVWAQIRGDIPRWYEMPGQWYEFSKRFMVDGQRYTVEFVMIDTVVFAGDSYFDEVLNVAIHPTGPVSKQAADSQLEWMTNVIANSTADYLFVVGHYPVWSVCSHGPTSMLLDHVKPVLEKYDATGYIAGHDHCQSFIQESKDGPIYPLAGNGHDCCYAPENYSKNPKGSVKYYMASDNKNKAQGGFASYTMEKEHLTVSFYDDSGNVMFTDSGKKPRKHRW